MADVLHQVGIQASPKKLNEALTAQPHIQARWSQHTKAETAVGHLNAVSFYGGMVTFELRV